MHILIVSRLPGTKFINPRVKKTWLQRERNQPYGDGHQQISDTTADPSCVFSGRESNLLEIHILNLRFFCSVRMDGRAPPRPPIPRRDITQSVGESSTVCLVFVAFIAKLSFQLLVSTHQLSSASIHIIHLRIYI